MIEYTQEMIEQDSLVKANRESPETMKRLHQSIVDQAVEEGFTGFAEVIHYANDGFTETEVFASEAERDEERETGNGFQMGVYTTCYQLIRALTIDNNKEFLKQTEESTQDGFSAKQINYIMESGFDTERSKSTNDEKLLTTVHSGNNVKGIFNRIKSLGIHHK